MQRKEQDHTSEESENSGGKTDGEFDDGDSGAINWRMKSGPERQVARTKNFIARMNGLEEEC